MVAERPLRWREAQALLCIDAEQSRVGGSSRSRSLQAKEFCGGAVDVYRVTGDDSCSEEMIRILHPKIKESLSAREPGMINIGLEHAKLSRFCSEYLTSQRFRADAFAEKVMTWEDIEFYEPLDYTVQHWYHHAKATIEAYRIHTEYGEAIKSLGIFLWAHMREASYWNGKPPKSIQDVLELFEHIHEGAHERNLQLRLESRVSFIRRQIENLYWNKAHSWEGVSTGLDGSEQKLILKCPKPWCSFFTGSFATIKDRDVHLERHQRPFYCAVQKCFAHKLGFESLQGLYCHHWRSHQPEFRLKSPQPSQDLPQALKEALSSGNPVVVEEALSLGEFTKSTLTTTLCMAASRGFLAVCKLLISKGADINGPGDESMESPLEAAASRGDADMVKLFLDRDVYPENSPEISLKFPAKLWT
ncbi:hypothetical protein NW754_003556 [Fusarium falciforme]|nr:hypothetical protein NW754_003556 [Fusarium falciforme]